MDADRKVAMAEQVETGRNAGDMLDKFAVRWFDGIKEKTLSKLENTTDEHDITMISANYIAAANLMNDLKAMVEKGKRAAQKLKEEASK